MAWFVRDIWHKQHSWYFKIVSNYTCLTAHEIFLQQFRNITRGIYAKNQYKSSYYLYKFPKHYQLKREQTFYVTSIIYKS